MGFNNNKPAAAPEKALYAKLSHEAYKHLKLLAASRGRLIKDILEELILNAEVDECDAK